MTTNRFTFEEVLGALGHVYDDDPDPSSPRMFNYVRHIAKSLNDCGSANVLCSKGTVMADGTDSWLMSPMLWRDSNCDECRRLAGITVRSLTKRSLLINCVNLAMNLEQDFLEAMWWNYNRKEGEEPINPDHDGFVAESWEQQVDQIIRMLERFRPTMQKHSSKFGWPDELSQNLEP